MHLQLSLPTLSLAAMALFAHIACAAPAPLPVPVPVPAPVAAAAAAPDLIAPPSGIDTGNSVCFKGLFASSCPGRWNEKDGTCCVSDD